MKIGILTCSSRLYPSMIFDIMDGYHGYFKSNGLEAPQFLIESIGTGGDYKLLYQKTQVLLLNPEVKIILAFIDTYAAKNIESFVNAAGKILISADTGADVPGVAIPSLNHLHVSLQSAYGSALAVYDAVKDGCLKNIFATSFYDGGYLHCYSAARVWEKNGGEVMFNFVTPFNANEMNIDMLASQMEEHKPQAIILQNSAESGQQFQEKYQSKNLPKDIPVYASPFMFEEGWISTVPFYFTQMQGYVAWHNSINTKNSNEFCAFIFNEHGKQASVFHLLGWDSAILVEAVVNMLKSKPGNAVQVLNEVTKKTYLSPRGELKWMEKFRHFIAPMYNVKLTDNNGLYRSEYTGKVSDDTGRWLEFAADIPVGTVSRWLNMYLCLS